LNYFNVDDRLNLVDLPGYGYARAPKTQISNWTRLTRSFLRGRAGLRRVFLLIDSRHGIKPSEKLCGAHRARSINAPLRTLNSWSPHLRKIQA